MEGEITRVNQPIYSTTTIPANATFNQNMSSSNSNANTTTFNLGANNNVDTIGTYMVPTQDLETYISELTDKGFVINSMQDFKDLRGGQKGTGDTQTLLVWGADSSATNLDQVISGLKGITPKLPYS